MEGKSQNPWMMKSVPFWVEEEDKLKAESTLLAIQQPETPKEPMEFLARSWSLSADEVTKALSGKQKQHAFDNNLTPIPETFIAQPNSRKVMEAIHCQTKGGAIGRLFQHKEGYTYTNSNSTVKKKDKARIENAHTHSALSIAGLAAALASATRTENNSNSKMSMALASATDLLASYCFELAQSTGADQRRLVSVVRSAVGIRTASDLLTLTAAAATALRGEAALKSRFPKESTKRSAAISPFEKKTLLDPHMLFQTEIEESDLPCVGDLLQLTTKGVLRWRQVSVYINKKGKVTIKMKSKHVGGAFTKKNRCVVYEVVDDSLGWPFRKERENMELYFGVKTAKGLWEFKCKNKIHKQKWVDGIQKLLMHGSCFEEAQNSLRILNINNSI